MRDIIFSVQSPDGKELCREWIAGDSWKNDYFKPIVENGVVWDSEVNVELIRKQYTGQKDSTGEMIFDGDRIKVMGIHFDVLVCWSDELAGWVLSAETLGAIHLTTKNIKAFCVTVVKPK